MAAKKDVVYLSLYLDTAKAEKAYKTLITLQGQLEEKLSEARKKAIAGKVDPKEDPTVKMIEKQLKDVKSVSRQFNATNREIAKAATDMSQMATSAINSLIRNVEKRLDGLKGKARESAKANELREILAQLRRERETRGLSAGYGLSLGGLEKELANTPKSIEALKKLREQFVAFRNYTTNAGSRDAANNYIRQLDADIRQMETAPLRDLTTILANIGNANNGSIEKLKSFREELVRLQQTSSNKADVLAASQAIAELDKRIAGMTKVTMSASQAETQYISAQNALKAGVQGRADKVRELIASMKQAQQAEGISIQQSQKYAAMEKELTNMLNNQAHTFMTAAQAHSAYNTAKNILAQGENASAQAVRNSIEAMKQAQQAQGTSVENNRLYVEMQKKLEQQLNNTAQSYMHLRQVRQVIDQGDGARVTSINQAIQSLQRLSQSEGTTAEQAKKYASMMNVLRERLKGASAASQELAYDQNFVKQTLNNVKTAPINDLEKAIRMLETEINNSSRSMKDFTQKQRDLKTMKEEVSRLKGEVSATSHSFQQQGDWITKATTKLMNYIGIFGGFYLLKQKLTEAWDANIKYDDSLTNIRKTTGLTAESVELLADNIKKIDTRTSMQEITDLAYSAGRLGVKGVSNVMDFVHAANQINIALGEQLNGAESVEQLMKITELMGTNKELGLEQALLKTGSAINHLTMNSQAVAQPIVDFMRRTAGIATQAGITADELVGFAGAVNALGQPVEMTATSFSKMIVQMEKNSTAVAKALKWNEAETRSFKDMLRTGHAMEAFLKVLERTRDLGGISNLSTIVKDLGSEGQRVIQTISTLSANYDFVAKMVGMSNKAYEEGVSVTNEYNIKNQNTAALLERLKNSFSKLMVSPEAIRWIRELLLSLQGLPNAVRDIVDTFSWFGEVMGGVLKTLAKFPEIFAGLLYYITGKSIINGLTTIWTKIMAIRTAWIEARAAGMGFFTALNKVMLSNLLGVIIWAVGTLVAHFQMASAEAKRMAKEVADTYTRIKEQSKGEGASLQTLIDKYKEAGDNLSARKAIIAEINDHYKDYINNILTEADSWERVAEVLETVNKQLELKALIEGKQKALTDVVQEKSEESGNARIALRESIAKMMPGFENDKDAARATASIIVDELLKKGKDGNLFGEQYLRKETNDEGKIEYYNPTSYLKTGGSKDADQKLMVALGQFLEGYGMTALRTNKNDNVVLANSETRAVADALYEYMNVQAKIINKQNAIRTTFDPEIKRISGEIGTFYKEQVTDGWNNIESAVMGGIGTITAQVTKKAEDAVDKIEGVAESATKETTKVTSESVRKGFENVVVPDWENKHGSGVGEKANNPGNLRADITGKAVGIYESSASGKFAKFASLADGFYANANQLLRYLDGRKKSQYGLDGQRNPSLRSVITTWAPPTENNTEAYLGDVAKAINVDKEAPVPISFKSMQALLTAISQRDSGIVNKEALEEGLTSLLNDYVAKGGVLDDNDIPIEVTFSTSTIQQGSGKGAQAAALRNEKDVKIAERQNGFDKYYESGYFSMRPEDELRWANQRDEMTDDERNAEIDRVEKAIAPMAEWIDDLKKDAVNQGTDQTKWTKEFREVYAMKKLAEGYLKILQLGELNEEDASKLKRANEDYNVLVKYLDEFYKERAAIIGEQRVGNEITETAKTQSLQENDINRHTSRETAFRTITGRKTEAEWIAQQANIEKEMNDIIAQLPKVMKDGKEVVAEQYLDMVENLRLAFEKIKGTNNLRLIGEAFENDDKKNTGEGKLAKISSDAAEDDRQNRVIRGKQAEEISKAWLERNPMGKLSKQYQEEFEKLGLMLVDLKKTATMSLDEMADLTMQAYLQVGRGAIKFNITTKDGLEDFRQSIKDTGILAAGAADADEEKLRQIYYKSYEYADQYREQLQRLTDRTMKIWNKMFDVSESHVAAEQMQKDLEAIVNAYSMAEKYGGSGRLKLEAVRDAKQVKVADETVRYQNLAANAYADKASADAFMQTAQKSGDANMIEQARGKVDEAQAEIDALPEKYQAVTAAIQELADAEFALKEATFEWVESMEGAFERFMDGFVPFRSWYENNGSFAANIFGTKSERQEAFGAFMDDLKKTVRNSIMEYTKMRVQKSVQDKIEQIAKRKGLIQETTLEKTKRQESMLFKLAADKMEMTSDQIKTTTEEANSTKATTIEIANKSTETSATVMGNLAQAVSKAFAQLGPIAGAVAAGVVSAAIGAVLTMAMNALGGGKKSSTATTPKTKLVSGMLTYDRGNVQSWSVRTFDVGNAVEYVQGDNGVYYAVQSRDIMTRAPHGLVTRPTLTTIGGAPALVAENGPEMVIGRETTRAMMMNNPALFRAILAYDRNHSAGFAKTFDSGNTQSFSSEQIDSMSQEEMKQIILGNQAALAQSASVNAALVEQLSRGIHASFNVHGSGGALDAISQGMAEERRRGNNRYSKLLVGG